MPPQLAKAAAAPPVPTSLLRYYNEGEGRRGSLTPTENMRMQDGRSQWFPELLQTEATTIPSMMASPGKQGLLAALLGGGLGAAGGYLAGPHLGGSQTSGALAGGLGLGGLAGIANYIRQVRRNDHLSETVHRMPPGATKKDYDIDARLSDALQDRFTGNKEGAFSLSGLADMAAQHPYATAGIGAAAAGGLGYALSDEEDKKRNALLAALAGGGLGFLGAKGYGAWQAGRQPQPPAGDATAPVSGAFKGIAEHVPKWLTAPSPHQALDAITPGDVQNRGMPTTGMTVTANDHVMSKLAMTAAEIKAESCPHCGARQERGDDGDCNRCSRPWPIKSAETKHTRSDATGTYDISRLFELLKDRKADTVPLANIKGINRSRRQGFSPVTRYPKADPSFPGIIDGDNNIVDGRHRALKLLASGSNAMPMHRVTPEDMAAVKTAAQRTCSCGTTMKGAWCPTCRTFDWKKAAKEAAETMIKSAANSRAELIKSLITRGLPKLAELVRGGNATMLKTVMNGVKHDAPAIERALAHDPLLGKEMSKLRLDWKAYNAINGEIGAIERAGSSAAVPHVGPSSPVPHAVPPVAGPGPAAPSPSVSAGPSPGAASVPSGATVPPTAAAPGPVSIDDFLRNEAAQLNRGADLRDPAAMAAYTKEWEARASRMASRRPPVAAVPPPSASAAVPPPAAGPAPVSPATPWYRKPPKEWDWYKSFDPAATAGIKSTAKKGLVGGGLVAATAAGGVGGQQLFGEKPPAKPATPVKPAVPPASGAGAGDGPGLWDTLKPHVPGALGAAGLGVAGAGLGSALGGMFDANDEDEDDGRGSHAGRNIGTALGGIGGAVGGYMLGNKYLPGIMPKAASDRAAEAATLGMFKLAGGAVGAMKAGLPVAERFLPKAVNAVKGFFGAGAKAAPAMSAARSAVTREASPAMSAARSAIVGDAAPLTSAVSKGVGSGGVGQGIGSAVERGPFTPGGVGKDVLDKSYGATTLNLPGMEPVFNRAGATAAEAQAAAAATAKTVGGAAPTATGSYSLHPNDSIGSRGINMERIPGESSRAMNLRGDALHEQQMLFQKAEAARVSAYEKEMTRTFGRTSTNTPAASLGPAGAAPASAAANPWTSATGSPSPVAPAAPAKAQGFWSESIFGKPRVPSSEPTKGLRGLLQRTWDRPTALKARNWIPAPAAQSLVGGVMGSMTANDVAGQDVPWYVSQPAGIAAGMALANPAARAAIMRSLAGRHLATSATGSMGGSFIGSGIDTIRNKLNPLSQQQMLDGMEDPDIAARQHADQTRYSRWLSRGGLGLGLPGLMGRNRKMPALDAADAAKLPGIGGTASRQAGNMGQGLMTVDPTTAAFEVPDMIRAVTGRGGYAGQSFGKRMFGENTSRRIGQGLGLTALGGTAAADAVGDFRQNTTNQAQDAGFKQVSDTARGMGVAPEQMEKIDRLRQMQRYVQQAKTPEQLASVLDGASPEFLATLTDPKTGRLSIDLINKSISGQLAAAQQQAVPGGGNSLITLAKKMIGQPSANTAPTTQPDGTRNMFSPLVDKFYGRNATPPPAGDAATTQPTASNAATTAIQQKVQQITQDAKAFVAKPLAQIAEKLGVTSPDQMSDRLDTLLKTDPKLRGADGKQLLPGGTKDLAAMLEKAKGGGAGAVGGVMDMIGGFADKILSMFGMDTQSMSGTQKAMILLGGLGLLAGGIGLMAGGGMGMGLLGAAGGAALGYGLTQFAKPVDPAAAGAVQTTRGIIDQLTPGLGGTSRPSSAQAVVQPKPVSALWSGLPPESVQA